MKTYFSLLTATTFLCIFSSGGFIDSLDGTPRPSSSDSRSARLDGGFIQFTNDVTKLKSTQWRDLIRQMYEEDKMDTVIIQRLGFRNGSNKYILTTPLVDPENPKYSAGMKLSSDDPTVSILTFADSTQQSQRPMRVFVGLWMEDNAQWNYGVPYDGKTVKELDEYLASVADKNKKWAELIWHLYHEHPSFRGWYIPHEYWNFPYGDEKQTERAEKQNLLRRFLSDVSNKCKALNEEDKKAGMKNVDRPVAFSVFFNPWLYEPYAGPPITKAVYASILQNSGIDILMLQDGSGARCLDSEKLDNEKVAKAREEIKREKVPEFFRVFAETCWVNSIRLWGDIEIYRTGANGCGGDQPAAKEPFQVSTVDQLKWQLTVTNRDPVDGKLYEPVLFERYVAFDIYHYLNSVVPDGFGAVSPRIERAKFLDDYKREFLSREFKP